MCKSFCKLYYYIIYIFFEYQFIFQLFICLFVCTGDYYNKTFTFHFIFVKLNLKDIINWFKHLIHIDMLVIIFYIISLNIYCILKP